MRDTNLETKILPVAAPVERKAFDDDDEGDDDVNMPLQAKAWEILTRARAREYQIILAQRRGMRNG